MLRLTPLRAVLVASIMVFAIYQMYFLSMDDNKIIHQKASEAIGEVRLVSGEKIIPLTDDDQRQARIRRYLAKISGELQQIPSWRQKAKAAAMAKQPQIFLISPWQDSDKELTYHWLAADTRDCGLNSQTGKVSSAMVKASKCIDSTIIDHVFPNTPYLKFIRKDLAPEESSWSDLISLEMKNLAAEYVIQQYRREFILGRWLFLMKGMGS